jgi:multidrug efflux pump subunit AcrA (membrane-fusion protein)
MVVVPLWSFFTSLLAELSLRSHQKFRFVRLIVILALLLAASLIPLPHSIVAPAVVEPSGAPVFASLTGELNSSAAYGRFVARGTIVATLSDPRLQRQQLRHQSAVRIHESRVRAIQLRRQDTATTSLSEARALLESSRKQLEEFERELDRLTVIAPISGTLMPPRARTAVVTEDALSQWGGYPLDAGNRGALIEKGTMLGVLCESTGRELLLQLDSHDAALLQRSQVADFQTTGNSGSTWRGIVKGIAPLATEDVPTELIVAELTQPPSVRKPSPDLRHWQAIVQLTIPDESPAPVLYSTGTVRVYVEPVSIASRIWQYLRTTFRSQAN